MKKIIPSSEISNEVFILDKTLKEIKETEKKSEDMINNGYKKSESILAEAKENTLKAIELKKQELTAYKEELLSKKKKELEEERAKILRDAQQKIQSIEQNAKKHEKQAIDALLKIFKSEIKG